MDCDFEETLHPDKQESSTALPAAALLLIASCGLIRQGNYRMALRMYPKCGGGGLNVVRLLDNGRMQRCFAIDYHPFWDKVSKQSRWRLHYHRGENNTQMKMHRPYEGGF